MGYGMSGDGISYPYITQYLENLLDRREGILAEIQKQLKPEEYIPIVDPVTASLLEVLCRLKQPESILEIGTAIGYSAILMQQAAGKSCHITTIEREKREADIAKENFKKAGLEDCITLIEGDAMESLQTLHSCYDMIFLDGAKGQYRAFLPLLLSKLHTGGLLVCDNVLYKGKTAQEGYPSHKHRTITTRLREFLTDITSDKSLQTTVLSVGDGVSVSIKLCDKEENQ